MALVTLSSLAFADDYFPNAPEKGGNSAVNAADLPLVDSGPAEYGGISDHLPITQSAPFVQKDMVDDAKEAARADVRTGGKPLSVPEFSAPSNGGAAPRKVTFKKKDDKATPVEWDVQRGGKPLSVPDFKSE